MTYRWYLNASGLISGTSIFPPQKSGVRPSSGAHSTYGIKTMMKTCPGSHSTFRIGRLDDLSYCHGAGASQRGHFGGYFGSPGHLTVRAPEGSPGGRRVLRTIYSHAYIVFLSEASSSSHFRHSGFCLHIGISESSSGPSRGKIG